MCATMRLKKGERVWYTERGRERERGGERERGERVSDLAYKIEKRLM